MLINGAEDLNDGDGDGVGDGGGHSDHNGKTDNDQMNAGSSKKAEADRNVERDVKAKGEAETESSKANKHRRDVITELWPCAQVEIFDFYPRPQNGERRGRGCLNPEFIRKRAEDITHKLQEAVWGRRSGGSEGTSSGSEVSLAFPFHSSEGGIV